MAANSAIKALGTQEADIHNLAPHTNIVPLVECLEVPILERVSMSGDLPEVALANYPANLFNTQAEASLAV